MTPDLFALGQSADGSDIIVSNTLAELTLELKNNDITLEVEEP